MSNRPQQMNSFVSPRDLVYDMGVLHPEEQGAQAVGGQTRKTASAQQHLESMCDDKPELSAEPYGWLLPRGYGSSSRCSSPTPDCDGMLAGSDGAELCISQGLPCAVVDWDAFDIYGGQDTSMSCKISSMQPEQLRQVSPLASALTASCHRSASGSHPAQSGWLKEEPEMEQGCGPCTGGFTDSGSFQDFTPKLPRVSIRCMRETCAA